MVLAARLSTAVQGDIPSTMRDLMMVIAAAHRYACAVSVQTCGSCSIKRYSVAAAHCRVWSWCREALRSSLMVMRRGRPKTAVSGYQLLMLDGPSIRIIRLLAASCAYVQRYSNTRFSKTLRLYLLDLPTPADHLLRPRFHALAAAHSRQNSRAETFRFPH